MRKILSILVMVSILVGSNNMSGIIVSAENAFVRTEDTLSNNKVTTVINEDNNIAVIMENGDLYCWGHNDNGQIGNGTIKNQTSPVKVLENIAFFSCDGFSYGDGTSAAITKNGDLYCWGGNESGQVGNGTIKDQTSPVKVLENVASFSFNDNGTSAAITKNGDLYCWGLNNNGQVGNGTTKDQTSPVKVLENVTSFSYDKNVDNAASAAITKNGDLYCWGLNYDGQVGNGAAGVQTSPVKVLENVASFFCDSDIYYGISSAITKNGDLYCWGRNESGQVGNGTTEEQTSPVKVLENVTSFYSYQDISTAITKNGDLYCWGRNESGQVGNGTIKDQTSPVKVLENVVSFFYGSVYRYDISAAITKNGDLYCWGGNPVGQVGNGTTKDQTSPVKMLENIASFSCDFGTSAAIAKNGDLYCWGHNNSGQVGNGTIKDQTSPVKVLENVVSFSFYIGEYDGTSAAITKNGDLYCWGGNDNGEVGNGTTEDQTTPIKILLGDNTKPPISEETPPNNTGNEEIKKPNFINTKPNTSNAVAAPKTLTIKKVAGYDKTTSYNLLKGSKVTLTTLISPVKSNQAIVASVDKKKVATVKVKGNKVIITAKKAGIAKVTIASAIKKSVKKVVTVKVLNKAVKAKKVTVKKKTLTIKRGKSASIVIKKITPKNYTDTISYKLKKKVKGISVDSYGKVTVTTKAKKGTKATVCVKVGKKTSINVIIKVK